MRKMSTLIPGGMPMDTYDDNTIIPDPVPDDDIQSHLAMGQNDLQEAENILPDTDAAGVTSVDSNSDGSYHGVGVGVRESTLSDAEFFSSQQRQKTFDPEACYYEMPRTMNQRKKRKKFAKKVLKITLAAVLVLVMVLVGCGVSVSIVNRHWQAYIQLMQQNFEQQMDVLRQELEVYKNDQKDTVILPVEGLSPAQIYDRNIGSVVALNCKVQTTDNGKIYEMISAGSGFVLSSDGYIVTNYHVVEGASAVNVTFVNGKSYAAEYIGGDATNDFAVIKINANNLKPVTIGRSSKLCVGDQVVAIGNALGELSFSLTVGYVSGTDRHIATDGSYINMIQTDASINSGNSGGPLFNSKGEVVGITTAKYSGTTSSGVSIEGIGFAIPVDEVYSMLEDLRQYGYITGAYLGVMVRDMDSAVAATYGFPMGAYVEDVPPGYAAARHGILPKDIITNVGGYDVACMSDLLKVLHRFEPGQKTTITVWRGGRYVTLSIIFDEKPQN
jgi:serine protease Do